MLSVKYATAPHSLFFNIWLFNSVEEYALAYVYIFPIFVLLKLVCPGCTFIVVALPVVVPFASLLADSYFPTHIPVNSLDHPPAFTSFIKAGCAIK